MKSFYCSGCCEDVPSDESSETCLREYPGKSFCDGCIEDLIEESDFYDSSEGMCQLYESQGY